jgi:hypothetical protein
MRFLVTFYHKMRYSSVNLNHSTSGFWEGKSSSLRGSSLTHQCMPLLCRDSSKNGPIFFIFLPFGQPALVFLLSGAKTKTLRNPEKCTQVTSRIATCTRCHHVACHSPWSCGCSARDAHTRHAASGNGPTVLSHCSGVIARPGYSGDACRAGPAMSLIMCAYGVYKS